MDFSMDPETIQAVEAVREWGCEAMRPAGLEADRLGAPLPVDHPYFQNSIKRGDGRTSWRPSGASTVRPRGGGTRNVDR